MKRLLTTTAIVAGAIWFGPAAYATPITVSSDILVNFSGSGNGITGTAKAEMGQFVFDTVNHKVTFKMIVTNTTASLLDVRFTSLGLDTAPATTAVTDTTNVYASTTNVGLGPDSLSLCFFGGPNCNGGGNGGLEDLANANLHGDPVTTGIFSVTVTFAALVPPLDFTNFNSKFQTEAGSFDAAGTVSPTCDGCVINPSAGAGIAGIARGWAARHRRVRAAPHTLTHARLGGQRVAGRNPCRSRSRRETTVVASVWRNGTERAIEVRFSSFLTINPVDEGPIRPACTPRLTFLG
jgi:hypothetical protein